MPDFSLKGSHTYWKEYPDDMIYRVIAFMESVEGWTHDGDPDVEYALLKLGRGLANVTKFELKDQETYIDIGNFLHISRVLFIMQSIDSTHPGAASRLLMHAEDNTENDDDPPGLFLRRNIVFERLRLLGRIFSNKRLQLIQQALEGNEDD
jgi:intracellular multiplication protein IcmW